MDRPAKDQPLTEWMRANKEVFGLPDAADGYTITRPDGLADGIGWNDALETAAKAKAHELGMTQAQLDGMSEMHLSVIRSMDEAATAAATAANDRMMADLTKDYGAALPEKLALARQAATVLGQKAGLDAAGLAAVAGVLTEKAGGDAATIRMFAALGEMMGDDRMVAGQTAGAETVAAAQQRLAQMQAPDGDYYKAVEKARNGDPAEMQRLKPEIDRLTRIAAGK